MDSPSPCPLALTCRIIASCTVDRWSVRCHGQLSKSDAAKVSGVSRQTLYVYLREGRLSADPDGRIDTAELLRAGFTLQGLQSADSQSVSEDLRELTPRSDVSDTLVDILRDRDPDLARGTPGRACRASGSPGAYRRAHGHAARGTQQNQRLLDMPRSTSAPSPPPSPAGPTADSRGAMRGASWPCCASTPRTDPAEIRSLLGVDRPLGDTLLGMRRDGLVQRVGHGRYVVAIPVPEAAR